MTSDDLLAWLHPFCGDASLPVRPRIDVLQILESNFSLQDSDVRLLLLYRTQAVLKDREVTRMHAQAAVTHQLLAHKVPTPEMLSTHYLRKQLQSQALENTEFWYLI